MTRKDFIVIAKCIARIQQDNLRAYISNKIGYVCARHNQRFDWERWNKACNVEQEK